MRCYHEASLYEDNCFITLTYDDEHLPPGGTLIKHHYQDFMKRLRWTFRPRRIRFFHCGEYGEKFERPHYHACIFNLDMPDKRLYSERDGVPLYTSELLDSLWGHGFTTVGDVTFESAAYVARYVMKKITGEQAAEHYETFDENTGEIFQKQPEYVTMSRRPGIGKGWLEKYKAEVFPSDTVLINGKLVKPPKFYDNQLPEDELTDIKDVRKLNAKQHADNNTTVRLRTRETVKKAQLGNLRRTLE
ncbi:replication initiator protein [Microviridae sp.]|nr:replication initiator protein [Microviridae sp.]